MTRQQRGAKGGKAGTGKAKARTKEQASAAAQARWKREITVRCCFTASEACHLLNLIARNEQSGEYNAPKDQYWKRSDRVKAKLTSTPIC